MRRMLIAVTFGLATSSAASAGTTATPRPLDVSTLPARCQPLAVVPASARIATPAFAVRLSVANCEAEEHLNALTLKHDDASLSAVKAAIAPSLALYADVLQHGDARLQIAALDARADLYVGIVVRLRAAGPYEPAFEPQLKPWLDAADADRAKIATMTSAARPTG